MRTVGAAERIGIRTVLVDATDKSAAGFYRRYGFHAATDDGLKLMVPLSAVRGQLAPLTGVPKGGAPPLSVRQERPVSAGRNRPLVATGEFGLDGL